MTYKNTSRRPEWEVNAATYMLYKRWDWEHLIKKACGITEIGNMEVSRITSNKCRIDNASESRQTCFGAMDESMFLKILGVSPEMTLTSCRIGFYDEKKRESNE